jgi:hypothetical protein
MRKALKVALLTLALACSVRAGDIPNGFTTDGYIPNGVAAPPPAAATTTTTDKTDSKETPSSVLTEAALNLVGSVLALF